MSTRTSAGRSGWIGSSLAALALAFSAAGAAQAQQDLCAGAHKILRLNGTETRFYGPVESPAALQAMFQEKREEITNLLMQVGFGGNPEDVFNAVRSGQGVSQISVAPGTRMGWMFFRRRGQPTARVDVCWAGGQAFRAYQIEVESNGVVYTLAVAEPCGNLFLLGQRQAPQPVAQGPSCNLRVTNRCNTFTVDATGTTGTASVTVTGPSGTQTLAAPSSPLRWTYEAPEREGNFRFVLRSTSAGGECTADQTVNLEIAAPTLRLSPSAVDVLTKEDVTVTALPGVDECAEVQSVTIDGATVAAPYASTFSWPRPGSYPIEGTVTDDFGQTARDSVTINVTRPPAVGWKLRPFATYIKPGDDHDRQILQPLPEHRNYFLNSGTGLGLEAEYQFRDWFGVGFGAMVTNPELHLTVDFPDAWLRDKDDVRTFTLFAGPLFHLTRGHRVDLFVGPMLAYHSFGDVDFPAIGPGYETDLDNDSSPGARIGLDLPFKRDGRWGLHLGAMYFDYDLESDGPLPFEVGVDPFHLNLGLVFDF